MQASRTNGERIGGDNILRLYGPWRAKDSGALREGSADLEGGTSAQIVRLVVYALTERGSGYAPGTLIAISDPVRIRAQQPRGWVGFTFSEHGPIGRDTRYALGVWFIGSGDARLWTEDRLGGRWDISTGQHDTAAGSDSAGGSEYASGSNLPRRFNLRSDTERNEDLPGLFVTLAVPVLAAPLEGMVRLTPEELPGHIPVINQLSGPHQWNGQTTVPGFPSGTAYRRFTWDQVEGSKPDRYNWKPIYREIAQAREAGQLFAFRVRARITRYHLPAYLDGRDFNDQYFRERHAALHRALRAEFGDHPDIAWIDLDGPGNYGEWIGGDYDNISTTAKQDVIRYLGEIWHDASVMLVVCTPRQEELNSLRNALPLLGFRNDIWGSEGGASQLWSAKEVPIRMDILNSGEQNLLLTGELDSEIANWSARSLHLHVLWFGPHSIGNGNFKAQDADFSRFSASEQAEIKQAFTKLGHRLVVSAVDVPETIVQNQPTTITFYWHNRNVTVPVGKDIGQGSLRLIDDQGNIAAIYPLAVDVNSLRPTDAAPHIREEHLTVRGLVAGTYRLELQIQLPTGRTLNLANTDRTADGAYPLGFVTIAGEDGQPPQESPYPLPER